MQLFYPVKKPMFMTQGFDDNFNPLYVQGGLRSHGATDFAAQYGDTIHASTDSYLYSTINLGLAPDKYRAIYTIIDEEDFSYEVTYGHIIDCLLPLKQFIKAGTPIGRAGNYGDVFTNGVKVTVEERLNGSHDGTHLHFQVRKCIRVNKRASGKVYLKDADGYVKLNGVFYEVVDHDNGNNGCIDPFPFYNQKYASEIGAKYVFTKDLTLGATGADVVALQKLLVASGQLVMPSGVAYGYFGELTRAAVIKYQISKGITPAVGYFGPLTRKSLL